MQEVELKFLNIDLQTFTEKLAAIGAKKEYDVQLESIYFEHKTLGITITPEKGRMLRLRRYPDKIVLTYKSMQTRTGAKIQDEHEVAVADFRAAIDLLIAMGFRASKPVLSRRVHYTLKEGAIELDTYEGKPTYVELEAHSAVALNTLCERLDLDPEDGTGMTAYELFPSLFN